MVLSGPAPKPTALKVLAGNPGHRPLNENEPKPELVTPACPDHVAGEARAEWDRIVPELERLGLLSRVDMAALAAYAVTYGRWVEAEKMVREHGLTMVSPNGHVQKSPYLTIADKAMEQMRRFIAEFGLSPASRSRVSVSSQDDADEDFFAVAS